jgi:fructokinase
MSLKVIGIGEVLWDLLPAGRQLGGAPANFAYHAGALGAQAGMVTRVGRDVLGQEILCVFEKLRLPANLVQVDETFPTGTVTVELAGEGVPNFTIHEHVAWDHLQLTDAALESARKADALCFGSLAQRAVTSCGTIQHLLHQSSPNALRIFDINLRQHFYSRTVIESSLQQANVLKLNDSELPVLATLFDLKGDPQPQLTALAQRFDLRVVALTLGSQGSLLYQDGRWSKCRTRPVRVEDTVGAGDAFTAALALGLLRRMDLEAINLAANEVASYVCSCAGATPPLPDSLRNLFTQPTAEAIARTP